MTAAKKQGMYVEETLVTPQMAEKWLEGNTHNRHIRDSVVERYGRDMTAGRWMLTHEAIAFDSHGKLIDGQHRLYAVFNTGIPTRFMVAYNAEMETQSVIDGSLPRTMRDVMRLSYNRDVSNVEVAIAKALASTKITGALTRNEIVNAHTTHHEAIKFAITAFSKKVRGVSVTPVLTVVARAWYSADRTRLAQFCEAMVTGKISADPRENAALLLRNWLLERAPRSGKAAKMSVSTVIYAKTERALAAYLLGEPVSTIYAATSEMFPLPQETVAPKSKKQRMNLSARQRMMVRRAAGTLPSQRKNATTL